MDFDSYARRLWAGRADAYEVELAAVPADGVGQVGPHAVPALPGQQE